MGADGQGQHAPIPVLFDFKRIPLQVDGQDQWDVVKRKGVEGWELVAVVGGHYYLQKAFHSVADFVSRGEAFCGTCPHYQSVSAKMGKCALHPRMIGPNHKACSDHPDLVDEEAWA